MSSTTESTTQKWRGTAALDVDCHVHIYTHTLNVYTKHGIRDTSKCVYRPYHNNYMYTYTRRVQVCSYIHDTHVCVYNTTYTKYVHVCMRMHAYTTHTRVRVYRHIHKVCAHVRAYTYIHDTDMCVCAACICIHTRRKHARVCNFSHTKCVYTCAYTQYIRVCITQKQHNIHAGSRTQSEETLTCARSYATKTYTRSLNA